MTHQEWKAFLPYDAALDRLNLVIRKGRPGDVVQVGSMSYVVDAMSVKIDMVPLSSPSTPAWVNENIDTGMLQALLNTMWEQGMRPTGYVAAGEIAALKEHLADLRRVAFKLLDIPKEPERSIRHVQV